MSDFDDIIEKVGGMGRYQAILIAMFFCLVLPTGYNTLLPLFVLTSPKHRCAIPGMPNDTYAVQSPFHKKLIDEWIPLVKDGDQMVMSSCQRFDNVTSYQQAGFQDQDNRSTVACDRWVFDKEYFDKTIIEELSLVCDQKEIRSHANSAMMAGKFVSALSEGILSDRFGRRVSLLTFIVIMICSSFANAFVFNIPSLIAFRFFSGLATTSAYMSAYLLTLEFMSPKYRQAFNVFAGVSWLAGAYTLTLVAYFVRNYYYLSLVTSAPTIILLSYFKILPESPRWSILHGRIKAAKTTLKRIARLNRKEFPEGTFDSLVERLHKERSTVISHPNPEEEPDANQVEVQHVNGDIKKGSDLSLDEDCDFKNENILVLVRHRRLAIRVLIVFWNWCANSMTYYGILFNVQNMVGSIYVNFTIYNTVDLVVNLLTLYVVDRFGRKKTYTFSFFLSAIACLSVIVPLELASSRDLNISVAALSTLGRAGVSAAFNIMYLYSSEMFPTTTRGTVLGMSSMCSRFGSLAAPYIADLGILIGGSLATSLPLIVFGSVGLLATISALFLPETLGLKMPNTVQDALEI